MNSDTRELVLQIFRDTGAIQNCEACGHEEIRSHDTDAEDKAYTRATNALKDGDRGFRMMEREDVMQQIKGRAPGCFRPMPQL